MPFLEHGTFLAVRAGLLADEADVFEFAYDSGWRRKEVETLPWTMVDLVANVLRLDPARSKTKKGRVVPIPAPLRAVLMRRHEVRTADCPLVFHRNGRPIRDWRTAWTNAVTAAKVPGLILHDCRRTAVRNLIRAGVPEKTAMAFTGHRTRSVFDRYNIVSERDLHDAGDKLATYMQTLEAIEALTAPAAKGDTDNSRTIDHADGTPRGANMR